MNAQQARIKALLDCLDDDTAVEIDTLTDLLAEGFDLRALEGRP